MRALVRKQPCLRTGTQINLLWPPTACAEAPSGPPATLQGVSHELGACPLLSCPHHAHSCGGHHWCTVGRAGHTALRQSVTGCAVACSSSLAATEPSGARGVWRRTFSSTSATQFQVFPPGTSDVNLMGVGSRGTLEGQTLGRTQILHP